MEQGRQWATLPRDWGEIVRGGLRWHFLPGGTADAKAGGPVERGSRRRPARVDRPPGELGITKAGNGYRRTRALEMAWGWDASTGEPGDTVVSGPVWPGDARLRKIGIVALARKLLIALWRFLKTGELPAGAVLKAAVSG